MLQSLTAACFFLLITQNTKDTLSAFALDIGKAKRSNAQHERKVSLVHVSSREVWVQQFPLECTSDIPDTLLLAR